jgi:YD repeat-containing protein
VKQVDTPTSVMGASSASTRDLTITWRYDAAGNVSRMIDALGNSTWYVHDADGELRQTIDALGDVSEYTYDPDGRVTQTRKYFNRLGASTVAAFGDVVGLQAPGANALDQRVYNVFDNDGRQRFLLVADNGTNWTISENRFDNDNNVVETRRYDKFLSETRINADDSATSPGISVAEVQAELATLGYNDASPSTLAGVRRTHFAFDAVNRLRFTVDALGDVTENAYDPAGNVVVTENYAARPVLTAWDEATINAAVNRHDTNNQQTRFVYDAASRLRFTTRALAIDAATGKPSLQVVVEQDYDGVGNLVQLVRYATPIAGVLPDYNESTLVSHLTASADDRRTAFAYDAANRQSYVLQALVTRDAQGNPQTRYVVMRQVYDALGYVIQSTAYATSIAAPANFLKSTIDHAVVASAQDRTTNTIYDLAGRERFIVAADGSFGEMVYDTLGRVTEQRQFAMTVGNVPLNLVALMNLRSSAHVGDGVTHGMKFTYDKLGQVLTTTDAMNFVETNVYDVFGNRTRFTDKNGNAWFYAYDRLGRMATQTAPFALMQLSTDTAGPVNHQPQTLYTYDALGRLVRKTEAANTADARVTTFGYDLLGRETSLKMPGFYDPTTGSVVATNATGRFPPTLLTTYDALGNVVKSSVRSGLNSFINEYKAYDNLGRVVYDVDGMTNVTGYGYDAFGDQHTVTRYSVAVNAPASGLWTVSALNTALAGDGAKRTVTMTYDTLGRKTSMVQPSSGNYYFPNALSGFVDPAGTPTLQTAQATTFFEYDNFGDLFHETVQQDTRSQETWHYYDAMGRETRTIYKESDNIAAEGQPARPGGYHTARLYDAFGNLSQVIEYATLGEGGQAGVYVPPALPSLSVNDRITAFLYDARGELAETDRDNLQYAAYDPASGTYVMKNTGRTAGVMVSQSTYDGIGHVRTSTDAMKNVTTYVYNTLGQLVQVTEPARTVIRAGVLDPFADLSAPVVASPVTTLVVNAFGQVVRSTRTLGDPNASGLVIVTSTRYDLAGNAITSTDANGNVTTRQYDFAGRVIDEQQQISAVLGQYSTAPTPDDLQTWQTVNYRIERRFTYDAVGRQTDALDVFGIGNGTFIQSGQHTVFDAFGEVTDKQTEWGDASLAPSALSRATTVHYDYDGDGHLVTQTGTDGITKFYYDLAGQVTRMEQRGNGSTADGTGSRITETVYDMRGHAVQQRRPAYSVNVPGFDDEFGEELATPVTEQVFDRWGNVVSRADEGITQDGFLLDRVITDYEYNADDKVVATHLPLVQALEGDYSTTYEANVTHTTRYDLMGREVQEIDSVADDPETAPNEADANLRTRTEVYDSIGQLVSETDATGNTTSYAYDANGKRIATLNALGTVFIDRFDANGNHVSHGVLRWLSDWSSPYVSGSGLTPVLVHLQDFFYDQANRVIETDSFLQPTLDGVGADYIADFSLYDERGFVRATLDVKLSRTPSFAFTGDSGRQTTTAYDWVGNRITTTDPYGNHQSWTYDTGPDANGVPSFTFGRLLKTTNVAASGTDIHETDYTYNDFGAVTREDYSGTDIPDPSQNYRLYSYLENGLLRGTSDFTQVGTPGATGGADYYKSHSSSTYEYTIKGQVAIDTEHTDGFYEDYGQGNIISTHALQTFDRITESSFDDQGRVDFVHVESFGRSTANTTFDYDALGNRLQVTFDSSAVAILPGGDSLDRQDITGRRLQFAYDDEGRMTLANRTVQDGVVLDPGVTITYDGLGRRATATTFEGHRTAFGALVSWDQSRVERYGYNDLGYLTRIDQSGIRNNISNPNDPSYTHDQSIFMLEETRVYDLLGHLTQNEQYMHFSFVSATDPDILAQAQRIVTNAYNAAGQLVVSNTEDLLDEANSSSVENNYDPSTGLLMSYTYSQGGALSPNPFVNTYTYDYEFIGGALRQHHLNLSSTLQGSLPSQTTMNYDARGNLVWQRKIDGLGAQQQLFFDYDSQGQALVKDGVDYTATQQGITGNTNNDYYYADGKAIGDIAASFFEDGTVLAHFDIDYTPVSPTYPGSQPGSVVVNPGDTLSAIAQSALGDASLWYLIANANGLTEGPNDSLGAETGRTLRIPDVVANDHNNAHTFTPYNPSTIIGDQTPNLAFAPPPVDDCAQTGAILGAVAGLIVSTVLGIVLSELGPAGQGIAAAAGDATKQAVVIGVTDKTWDDFSGWEVAEAGAEGLVSGAIGDGADEIANDLGGGLGTQAIAGAASAAVTYAAKYEIHTIFHPNDQNNGFHGWDFLASTAGGATTPVIGGTLEGFGLGALSPQSGWAWDDKTRTWDTLLLQAGESAGAYALGKAITPRNADCGPQPEEGAVPLSIDVGDATGGDAQSQQGTGMGGVVTTARSLLGMLSDAVGSAVDAVSGAASAIGSAADAATADGAGGTDESEPGQPDEVFVVQHRHKTTEQIAEDMGYPRSYGSALAVANGYDPRYVKEGDVFHWVPISSDEADGANAYWYPKEAVAKTEHIAAAKRAAEAAAKAAADKAAQDAANAAAARAAADAAKAAEAADEGKTCSAADDPAFKQVLDEFDAAQPALARLQAADDAAAARQAAAAAQNRAQPADNLPPVKDLYTPLVGYWQAKQARDTEGYMNSDNSVLDRIFYFLAATGDSLPALIETPVTAAYNAPNNAARMGQEIARAKLATDSETEVLATLNAVKDGADAFTGLGGVFSLASPHPTTVEATPLAADVTRDVEAAPSTAPAPGAATSAETAAASEAQDLGYVDETRAPGNGTEGHKYATDVLEGGTGDAWAGHGSRRPGSLSGTTTVPEGTTLTMPRDGISISDETGRYMEAGDWEGLAKAAETNPKIADDIEGMASHLPGAEVRTYTLRAPNRLTVYENSFTVEDPASLGDLLQPNQGHRVWAACTAIK